MQSVNTDDKHKARIDIQSTQRKESPFGTYLALALIVLPSLEVSNTIHSKEKHCCHKRDSCNNCKGFKASALANGGRKALKQIVSKSFQHLECERRQGWSGNKRNTYEKYVKNTFSSSL